MKRLASLSLLLLPLFAACGGDDDGGDDAAFDDAAVIVAFADDVVVPTYELLAERIDALDAAAHDLADDPSEANLDAAQAAWVAAREPWEQSEGFLFGPVDSFGYDPALDSWPVNRTDLEAVLAGDDDLTVEYVAGLAETQKGFHTSEYIVFGENDDQEAGELDARELEYLVALTGEMKTNSDALAQRWTEAVDGAEPYRDVLATAGEDGNTAYPSLGSAAQEILVGMAGICDEVANGKIADPYDAGDPELVESQFSFNSLIDFTNNMRSVENAYLGRSAAGTQGRGMSDFVAELDADLDARVKAEIAAAIDALDAIPDPFPEAIVDADAADEIEAAQAAIRTLQATIEGDLTATVLQ
jgi:predicted lipoprotein